MVVCIAMHMPAHRWGNTAGVGRRAAHIWNGHIHGHRQCTGNSGTDAHRNSGTIAYTLTAQNGMVIFVGNTAATFTGTGTTTLSLAVAEGQTLTPGSYTDTLTFTASVE